MNARSKAYFRAAEKAYIGGKIGFTFDFEK
jgi:hypothetical protein